MKKILYSGTGQDGKAQRGFIEAASNREALDTLRDQGLTEVQLHDDVALALDRSDLDKLGEAELAQLAEFELHLRNNPSTGAFVTGVLVQSKLLIAIGAALVGWGVYGDITWLWIAGIVIAAALPAFALFNYRTTLQYDALLRASALGDLPEVQRLVTQLSPKFTAPEMALDLAIRNACAMKGQETLESALQSVEPLRSAVEEPSPGMFEGQVALVHHFFGDYDGFLEQMRAAYRQSQESPTIIVDLALAEARFGDLARAEELLANAVEEELPPHGQPFIHWARGMIAKRLDDPSAVDHLRAALAGLTAFGENPAVWTALALCAGCYLSVLDPEQDTEQAQQLLGMFGEILKQHGDRELLETLRDSYPTLWN